MGLELLSTNDANALGALDLRGLEGVTLLFGLGYYSHAHFLRLLEGGVSFVTRLNAQASYQPTHSEELPKRGLTTPEREMCALRSDHHGQPQQPSRYGP